MKPSSFTHYEPRSLEEALTILSEVAGDEGRILAGGQTLIPAMALRLARPSHLVDINRIEELRLIRNEADHLVIGACVRHAAFHQPVVAGPLGHLLSTVVKHIAHLPIRTRGTFCGSLANADGASEWCLVAVTLGAVLVARSVRGERLIPASEFFVGFMTTALDADEMLTEVRLPPLSAASRFGFEEYSRRSGDFAQAMSLVVFELQGGVMRAVRIGIGGVSGSVLTVPTAEALLEGQAPGAEVFERAAQAVAEAIEPSDALAQDQAYRRDLARAVVARALAKAAATPGNESKGIPS